MRYFVVGIAPTLINKFEVGLGLFETIFKYVLSRGVYLNDFVLKKINMTNARAVEYLNTLNKFRLYDDKKLRTIKKSGIQEIVKRVLIEIFHLELIDHGYIPINESNTKDRFRIKVNRKKLLAIARYFLNGLKMNEARNNPNMIPKGIIFFCDWMSRIRVMLVYFSKYSFTYKGAIELGF